MRVSGYRVAYSTADGSEHGEGSAARLLGDVLSGVGLDELVGESLAHLPLSREALLALGVPPVRPDKVLLRIAHDTALDPEVAQTIEALTDAGYALSLYDLPGAQFDAALLERFGTVEVDFSRWSAGRGGAARCRGSGPAGRCRWPSGLVDYTAFEQAKGLGFELFAGPFYASRHKAEVRNDPGRRDGDAGRRSPRMQSGSATIEELEQVIDRDVGLSVKLLRYINSAYMGMRGSIGSIRQAVMMLGSRGVSRWALLVALTGGPSAPRELSVVGLTRARMCELLGSDREDVAGDQLFTVGLLSVADALLEVPLETIVEELPLADEVGAALLRRDGPAGAILDAVVSYEQGEFDARQLQSHTPGHRHLLPRRARLGRRDRLGAGRLTPAGRSRTVPRQ